jgi:hypothetical protein
MIPAPRIDESGGVTSVRHPLLRPAAVPVNAVVWMLPPVHQVDSWARAVADLTLWLLPAAVTIAVLRHQLYGIDRLGQGR